MSVQCGAPPAAIRRSIIGNFLPLAFSTWGAQALNFLVLVWVARTLGAAALGRIALAQSLVLYFRLAADAGFDLTGSRRLAANPAALPQTVAELSACRLINAIIAASLLVPVALAVDAFLPIGALTLMFGASLLPIALSREWGFMGLERMDMVGVTRFTAALVWLVLARALVRPDTSILVVPATYLVGVMSSAFLSVALFRSRYGGIRPRFDAGVWKTALREAAPIGLSQVVGQILVGSGLVVLGFMVGERAAGLYAAPQRIVLFLTGASSIFGAVLYPRLAAAWAAGRDEFEQVLRLGFRTMLYSGVAIGVGGVVLAEPLVVAVYGPDFREVTAVFRWLVPVVIPIFVNALFGPAVLAAGGGRDYFKACVAGAAVNVAANVLLCPRLHELGPVASTFCGEGTVLVMLALAVRRRVRVDVARVVATACVASALMAGVLAVSPPMSLLVLIPAGAAAYAFALAAFRGVTRTDIAALLDLAATPPPIRGSE